MRFVKMMAVTLAAMPEEVDQFLKEGGFLQGDYIKLEDFPEAHAGKKFPSQSHQWWR